MKRIISFILATVLLLGLCACGSNSKEQEQNSITEDMLIGKTFTTGDYLRANKDGVDTAFYSMTFENDGLVEIVGLSEMNGEWFIEDNRLLIHGYLYDSSSYKYIDGYLVAENSLINGVIPDGDKFAGTITYIENSTNTKMVFNFKIDGTYEKIYYDNSDGEENGRVAGEYIREGNLISVTSIDKSGNTKVSNYLYYDGGNRVYKSVLLPE